MPLFSDGHRFFLPLVQRPTWTERQVPRQPEFLPTDAQWYLPFLAAPNLPFRKAGPHPYAVGYPHQGIDEASHSLDAWADLVGFNWYNWKGGWYIPQIVTISLAHPWFS